MARRRRTSANPAYTIDLSRFSPDVRDLLRLLHEHEIRYVVVGGQAVIFYGHVRATGDIDIFFDRTEQNAAALFDVLQQFWNGTAPGVAGPDDLLPESLILQYGVPPNRIDLINNVEGITFQEAWDDRLDVQMELGDERIIVHFIGITALMKNKEAIGRAQDLADLAFLKKTAQQWSR